MFYVGWSDQFGRSLPWGHCQTHLPTVSHILAPATGHKLIVCGEVPDNGGAHKRPQFPTPADSTPEIFAALAYSGLRT